MKVLVLVLLCALSAYAATLYTADTDCSEGFLTINKFDKKSGEVKFLSKAAITCDPADVPTTVVWANMLTTKPIGFVVMVNILPFNSRDQVYMYYYFDTEGKLEKNVTLHEHTHHHNLYSMFSMDAERESFISVTVLSDGDVEFRERSIFNISDLLQAKKMTPPEGMTVGFPLAADPQNECYLTIGMFSPTAGAVSTNAIALSRPGFEILYNEPVPGGDIWAPFDTDADIAYGLSTPASDPGNPTWFTSTNIVSKQSSVIDTFNYQMNINFMKVCGHHNVHMVIDNQDSEEDNWKFCTYKNLPKGSDATSTCHDMYGDNLDELTFFALDV